MSQEWGKSPLIGHTFTVHLQHERDASGEKVHVLDLTQGLIRLHFVDRAAQKIAWVPLTCIRALYEDDAYPLIEDEMEPTHAAAVSPIW